jgi:hypothetical protein
MLYLGFFFANILGILGNESRSCNETSTSPLGSSGQGEGSYLHDEPLSPSRALRAAMLRSRFAGTIVKAQQKALLDHVIFEKYVLNLVVCCWAMLLQLWSSC